METKYKAVISGLLIFLFACSGDSKNSSQNSSYSFNVVFTIGTITDDKIYAVWAETTDGDFIQNIWVCQNSIIKYKREMPSYWYAKIKEQATSDEIAAVTRATQNTTSFTIDNISLNDSSIRSFYVYFEIDRSWDANDWFPYTSSYPDGQPAILYKTLVDLDSTDTEFTLLPVGWTAGATSDLTSASYIPDFELDELNPEMRYITQLRNSDGSFGGDALAENVAINMVGRIKVTVNK